MASAATPASAAEVVLDYLTAQVAALHAQHARLQADEPGAVHQLRVAARRLRSALTTHAPLLARDDAGAVRHELRWLGRTLSEARDAQVLRERWRLLLLDEPTEPGLGPVVSRIHGDLDAAERAGKEQARRVLDGARFGRLLEALDDLVRRDAFTAGAEAPPAEVFPVLLQGEAERLRRAVSEIADAESTEERDVALHNARKKAKRLRYAAESTRPGLGEHASLLAAAAADLQRVLGEHQDSVMSRQRLGEYAVRARAGGAGGDLFDRLHAGELARAATALRHFEAAWKDMPTKRRDRVAT